MDFVWLLLIFVAALLNVTKARDFTYNGQSGPSAWSDEFSSCKGKHQSPIDIDMLHVKKVNLPPLILHNFDKPPNVTQIENNGHTVYFTLGSQEFVPSIEGGPFMSKYQFSQLHYHWGDNDTYGSEDAFNGKHFPMELHVVFFKSEYESMKEATTHSDGLAVMAFFFKVSNPNPAYEEMSKLLETITKPQMVATFTNPVALKGLVSNDMTEYYVYNGSLTTPPCLEVVTWMDFYDPIEISHDQLKRFRMLEDSEGHSLSHNFRPIQPIGDRVVWHSSDKFHPEDEDLHDAIHGTKTNKKSKNSSLMLHAERTTIIFCAISCAFLMLGFLLNPFKFV